MNRAVIALRKKLMKAPEHIQNGILFVNVIHDANYQLVRECPEVIKWLNDNIIKEMEWTCDEIYHPDVPMSAALDLGKSWKSMKSLKNNASIEEVEEFLNALQQDTQLG